MRLVSLGACLLPLCYADLYLHTPHGGNDRNRERDEQRNNGNLIFDSQNNDKGGYPWAGDREAQCGDNEASLPACAARNDVMSYYEGSVMDIEWTAQHACGPNPNVHCMMVIQYSCDLSEGVVGRQLHRHLQRGGAQNALRTGLAALRDGYPTGGQTTVQDNNGNNPGNDGTNDQYDEEEFAQGNGGGNQNARGTQRIGGNTDDNVQFAKHESQELYQTICQNTQRNKGLYTADQNLNNDDARSTRQNPNGNRNGFECPEERDYYPYWAPTPYIDIAIQTSNTSWCQYYKEQSPNVKKLGYCDGNGNVGITEAACDGQWTERPALSDQLPGQVTGPPECSLHAYSEDNHLGKAAPVAAKQGNAFDFQLEDAALPKSASQSWTVPNLPTVGNAQALFCTLRLRYNMTSNDYPSTDVFAEQMNFDGPTANCKGGAGVNLQLNPADVNDVGTGVSTGCAEGMYEDRPLYNRPYIDVLAGTDGVGAGAQATGDATRLSLATNTNQLGRTFQDRSYLFKIAKRPTTIAANTKIYNLNTAGRRGNIVQSYPGVEYDFVPNDLEVTDQEYVHWQWMGSDYNENRNPNNAEGWRYSDRTNLVQFQEDGNSQTPAKPADVTLTNSKTTLRRFALADTEVNPQEQGTGCKAYTANNPNTNEEQNNVDNCGKMNNAKAHFNLEPEVAPNANSNSYSAAGRSLLRRLQTNPVNDFHYGSTRNNNFSNRSNKSHIKVRNKPPTLFNVEGVDPVLLAVLITFGVLLLCVCVAGVIWYKMKARRKAQYPQQGQQMQGQAFYG